MRISKRNIPENLIAILLCLLAGTSQLLYIVFNSSEILVIVFSMFILIVMLVFARPKLVNSRSMIFAIAMIVCYAYNCRFIQTKQWTFACTFIGGILLCVLAGERIVWAKRAICIMEIVCGIYAICTIVFFFTPGFYKGNIATLFPDYTNRLIEWYDSGCMSGLTHHYSVNGMFLAEGCCLALAHVFSRPKSKSKAWLYLAMMAVALLLTGKRAHVLFVGCAAYIVYYFYESNHKRMRLFKMIGILLASMFIGTIVISAVPALGTSFSRILEGASSTDITNNRILWWTLAIDLFKTHPLLGIGWGNFAEECASHAQTLYYYANAHNVYLQLLCEVGIVGFTLFLLWMIRSLVRTVKLFTKIRSSFSVGDEEAYAISFSLCYQLFFMLYSFTGNPLYDIETYVLYFIACAIPVYYSKGNVMMLWSKLL